MYRETWTHITLELLAKTRLWLKNIVANVFSSIALGSLREGVVQDGAQVYVSVKQGGEKSQGPEEGMGTKTWDPAAIPSRSQWKHRPIAVLPVHPSKGGLQHQTCLSWSPDAF